MIEVPFCWHEGNLCRPAGYTGQKDAGRCLCLDCDEQKAANKFISLTMPHLSELPADTLESIEKALDVMVESYYQHGKFDQLHGITSIKEREMKHDN
jgi:hypothetical protein